MDLKDHRLVPGYEFKHIHYGTRPVLGKDGQPDDKLHAVEIFLNNPKQLNSYTTEAVKEMVLAFQTAGCDRYAVAAILGAVGDRAFCTGGNTDEYANYYANHHPQEYAQYMWLFNSMVTNILMCQIPVITRVNGMCVAGGQEIRMAGDFHVAVDYALFGQAGPRHGSAPVGGSTDFLPLYVGIQRAMNSIVMCNMWGAHEAKNIGLIDEVAQAYRLNDEFVPYPLLNEDGSMKTGEAKKQAIKQIKDQLKSGEAKIDFILLDKQVDAYVSQLADLFPLCVTHSIDQVRQLKLMRWMQNSPANRNLLALNMMVEGPPGFKAFEAGRGTKNQVVDFKMYRKMVAEGYPMDKIIPEIYPWPDAA